LISKALGGKPEFAVAAVHELVEEISAERVEPGQRRS
jgi:hypothetical protein